MTDKTIFKVFLNKKIPIEKSMRLTYSFLFLYFSKNESVLVEVDFGFRVNLLSANQAI